MWSPPPRSTLLIKTLGTYSESETIIFTTLLAMVFKAWWTNFKTHNENMHI